MIKPNAVEDGNTGAIIKMIEDAGFRICAMKRLLLTKSDAESFYMIHKERSFFGDLIKFITRSPIVALALEKDNVVEDFRKLIGSTDPEEAEEGTIRKLFAKNVEENAVHGSDSDDNANTEIQFHFASKEIV
ncbi:nucleoside diphosphate kinase [Elysia marginata]|uniref:Nucleoside diphosphate kinase n=1 Tax=Elysia marginata TaxID=1093978 RepID=A0AAV4G787_9GAST|nr:nucleoside diphosphate kinase [Elysia marginata]